MLAERSVAVLLLELMAVQVLSCCFTPAHEEEMVSPQTQRICEDYERIHAHGSWDAPNIKSVCKVGVVPVHPNEDVSKTGGEKK